MRVLGELEPKGVFEFFEDLCAIPHGSGDTKRISDYCVQFAKLRNLEYIQDEFNNVIIKKNASPGYENHPAVILQGHLDMVCEKEPDLNFDFASDGLNLAVEGDFVTAKGTTLGGDDGIAVAMALSILNDDALLHPSLEVLFTTDEETGMDGAEGLDMSRLSGKMLINIDSENEGVFTVGCAGGARADIKKKFEYSAEMNTSKITILGLLGGHSGVEIHKNRHNANKLMCELLCKIPKFNLASLEGGAKDNVIPSTSECLIYTDCDLQSAIDDFLKEKYNENDSGFKITVAPGGVRPVLSSEESREVASLICDFPNGVQSMSKKIEGLVETSLNLGVLTLTNGELKCTFSVRSSVNSEKAQLLERLKSIAQKYNAEFSEHGHYPAWEYRENSPLRDVLVSTFKDLYGKEPVVDVIHAGLECGLFCEKRKDLDAVSIGPDIFDIHSVSERLSISSTARTYAFLCEALKRM